MLTQMTHLKVSYHERQIKNSDTEEDIKFREKRIKALQRDLQEARQAIASGGQHAVSLQADIVLTID